jgi:hypothetical protein
MLFLYSNVMFNECMNISDSNDPMRFKANPDGLESKVISLYSNE